MLILTKCSSKINLRLVSIILRNLPGEIACLHFSEHKFTFLKGLEGAFFSLLFVFFVLFFSGLEAWGSKHLILNRFDDPFNSPITGVVHLKC